MLADKTDLENIDEPLKIWLRLARSYCDVMNVGDNSTGFKIKLMLDLLVGILSAPIQKPLLKTLNHQPDPHRQVIKLFDELRADPEFRSFAVDVQRMTLLDSTYKTLVFEEWTRNLNLPEDMLPIFVDTKFEPFKNPLFLAWLNYVDWYWTFAKDQRLDRYIKLIRFLCTFKGKTQMDGIEFEKWMKTEILTVDNSKMIQDVLHGKSLTKNDELTWIIHYVNTDKENFPNSNFSKLLDFLISMVGFDKLVELLKSLNEDLELKQLLMKANVTADQYYSYLVMTAKLFALSEHPINVQYQFDRYAIELNKDKKYKMSATASRDKALNYMQQNPDPKASTQMIKRRQPLGKIRREFH
ncbi:uncharacterized protein PHALS_07546 [Plasmopara halstedii]|uniref:RXLR phytopathogen effector protein WY-domain domain-containing protein n=1 Tax=Plasmopara halstedii TaxID=4781 RepID=A0A0P1B7T2_PLAHL|nr:uncharacterized protein PHALS_07546 [Plasmopara halstedii]CEG49802.1 hypothetical protein PHALS_07546 [Plasmopara halstedii]|eukprot:XP_024586171.1 hypothetical protein PHALS_07546 [Plasmopara halstedii]